MNKEEKYIRAYEDKETYLTSRFTREMATEIPTNDDKFYDFVGMAYDYLDTFDKEELIKVSYDNLLKGFVGFVNKYHKKYVEEE